MHYKPYSVTIRQRRNYRMQPPPPNFDSHHLRQVEEPVDFGITGLKYVFDKNMNVWNRIGWLLALITCSVACTYQLSDRVSYYLTEPVTTTVAVKYTGGKVPMPSLTVCPSISTTMRVVDLIVMHLAGRETGRREEDCPECMKDLDKLPSKVKMSKVWEVFEVNGSAVETFLYVNIGREVNIFGTYLKKVRECTDHSCFILRTRTLFTVAKFQISYKFHLYNIFPVLSQLSPCTQKCYSPSDFTFDFQFHDAEVAQKYLVAFYDNAIKSGEESFYRITIKQFFLKNTRVQPCSSNWDAMKKLAKCMEAVMLKNIPCRLPFLKTKSPLKLCESPQTMKEAFKKVLSVYLVNEKETIAECENTMGSLHCNKTIFTTEHKYALGPGDNYTVRIRADVQNMFESIHEEYAYTGTALTSDISRSLGFLLGVCLLHVVELIDYLFTKLSRLVKKRTNSMHQ